METPEDNKRNEAIKGLINIALFEGFVLLAVVGIYLKTNNLTHLIGGVVATIICFAPVTLRWVREHGDALKATPGEDSHG
ncbi:hypothetical protein [Hyphococcus sp.]|uniref:hypothetical protein n=1 Tax=Hyphococcus sp. TaxID=2038636 RepID=UPI0020830D79|nr:MAG: hypothetical protein DHS20C04_32040 [Marinicaulis sp.]